MNDEQERKDKSRKGGGKGRGQGGRGPGGPGRRGRGRHPEPPTTSAEELRAWFAGNLPDDWFTEPVAIRFDRDEVIVHGTLAPSAVDGDTSEAFANRARIDAFRETTREDRIAIALRAEEQFLRKVSWTVSCGEEYREYTVANVPVMTRLHIEDRAILDTLIDAGVARSRSEALAWTVRLVAENESDWLNELREAMTSVEEVRKQGPTSRP